jgi:cytochrome oxidase Cu insertion factor (SCO1/SenC/PrrC family)
MIMGVSVDNEPDPVPEFVRRYSIDYPVLWDNMGVGGTYNVRGIPTLVLIDRQGRIRRTITGEPNESDLQSDIEGML